MYMEKVCFLTQKAPKLGLRKFTDVIECRICCASYVCVCVCVCINCMTGKPAGTDHCC